MASSFYPGLEKGRVGRYDPEESEKALTETLEESEKKAQRKKKKMDERTRKKKPVRNTNNLRPFGGGDTKTQNSSNSKLSKPAIDPLLKVSAETDGKVINVRNVTTEGETTSSVASSSQELSNVERKKLENAEELVFGEFEMKLLGMLDVWDPMQWKMEFLCHRSVTFEWTARLSEFENDPTKSLCLKNTTQMMKIMSTRFEELVHLTPQMVQIHDDRQKMGVFTPFLIKARGTSDLPFPVHVISQCQFEADRMTTKADACNQRFIAHSSSICSDKKILTTIYPMNESYEFDIVSDFRNEYTDKQSSSSFQLNLGEVEKSLSFTSYASGAKLVKIQVDSYFEQVVGALSQTTFSSLSIMKQDAERLMLQIANSTVVSENGTKWYNQVEYDLTVQCQKHIEKIRLSIPKYDILAYKVIPARDYIRWDDSSTWPVAYMNKLGFMDISPAKTAEMLATTNFTISLTLDYYYL